jgi:membrane protease YdiL (CAAX protease family)
MADSSNRDASANREASGFQIAFLVLAVTLLAIAAMKVIAPWHEEREQLLSRLFIFGTFLLALLCVPALRQACAARLRNPIPRAHRPEVLAVAIFHLLTPFAFTGALVAYTWLSEGPLAIAEKLSRYASVDTTVASHLSLAALAVALLGWSLGPFVEELVFRGFMFRAWARQWGWLAGLLLTASMFGLYHDLFALSFTSSLIYTCLYVRTGSLWAPIAAHCLYNVATWTPFLGQFVFSGLGYDAAILSNWWFHFTCLFLHLMILPMYVWMAAEREETELSGEPLRSEPART